MFIRNGSFRNTNHTRLVRILGFQGLDGPAGIPLQLNQLDSGYKYPKRINEVVRRVSPMWGSMNDKLDVYLKFGRFYEDVCILDKIFNFPDAIVNVARCI